MEQKNGVLALLVESTLTMERPMVLPSAKGDPLKVARSELLTTAISGFLQRLGNQVNMGVVCAGYSLNEDGLSRLTSRTGTEVDSLEPEQLSTVIGSPLETRQVSRRSAGGAESTVEMPIHIQFDLQESKASHAEPFSAVASVLSAVSPQTSIVINLFCSESAGANPQKIAEQLMSNEAADAVLINVHLGGGEELATLYPSRKLALRGYPRQLFTRSSELPPELSKHLHAAGAQVLAKARGVLMNASIVDVAQLLNGIEKYILAEWPQGTIAIAPDTIQSAAAVDAEEASDNADNDDVSDDDDESDDIETLDDSAEDSSLSLSEEAESGSTNVLFVLQTGVADPCADEAGAAVRALVDVVNETIDATRQLDTSLSFLSVTRDSDSDMEITSWFPGDTEQSPSIIAANLHDVALDQIESSQEVSDGAGGLISMPVTKYVYVQAEPGFECSLSEFVDPIKQLIDADPVHQVIVWFVAGTPDESDLQAIESIGESGRPSMIACVQTVTGHPPVGAPLGDVSQLQDPGLVRLSESCRDSQSDAPDATVVCVNSSRGLIDALRSCVAIE
jgi:hypothetical protein